MHYNAFPGFATWDVVTHMSHSCSTPPQSRHQTHGHTEVFVLYSSPSPLLECLQLVFPLESMTRMLASHATTCSAAFLNFYFSWDIFSSIQHYPIQDVFL